MNILILTTMYPDSVHTKRIATSFAVHNFVKYWGEEHTVRVLKVNSFGIRQAYRGFLDRGEYSIEGVPVKKIAVCTINFLRIKTIFFSSFIARRHLRKYGFVPDVIVSHCSTSHLLACRINEKQYHAPHVCGIHKADVSKVYKSEKGFRSCFAAANLLAFRSKPIKEKFSAFMPSGLRLPPSIIVSSGIENDFIENAEFIHDKMKQMRRPLRIVTVASLIPLKKIDTIIKALQRMKDTDWEYTIVGDGPERKNLESLVEEGYREKITFAGYLDRDEIGSLLKNSDIFILVSERETFGLVYLEALAKGCIVIGSKGWGIDGIIVNGRNGFLCEPGATVQIRDTIEHIISMKAEERQGLIQAGHRTVCDLDEKKIALDYLDEIVKMKTKYNAKTEE